MLQRTPPGPGPERVPRWVGIVTLILVALLCGATIALFRTDTSY